MLRDQIQRTLPFVKLPDRFAAMFFMPTLMIILVGCQVSMPVKNRSGSVVDAARDAELDFDNGRHRMLIGLSPRSDDFREMQALLKAHNVKLIPYFPQSSLESSYSSSYNKTMSSRLKGLHGQDVYKDAWSQVDDTQYFGTENYEVPSD